MPANQKKIEPEKIKPKVEIPKLTKDEIQLLINILAQSRFTVVEAQNTIIPLVNKLSKILELS